MSATDPDPDWLYAKGGITREEWMRLRPPAAAGTPKPVTPVPPRRPPASNGRTSLAVSVVLVVVLVTLGGLWFYLRTSSGSGTSPTYGTPRELAATDLAALNASATAGVAFLGNNSLWLSPGSVDLVVYASPPAHDLAFVVQGMVNPAIHVAPGSRVTVTVVNTDGDMYHNWALSTQGPPYGSMPMMGGGGMMGGGTRMAMTMLGPASGGGYWSQAMAFTASAGSYWYLCEYPDHANEGMYGSFSVG